MSSSSLTWSLMSKLVDDTWPRIPTDFTIHLVDEEAGEWEEGFQVLREPVQVEAHRMVLALVSPVLHALLYNNYQPPSSITLECSPGSLTAVLAHIYSRQLEWAKLTPTERDQVVSLGRQYQIVGLLEAAAVAEEELLDELFAVSLQTKLLSSEEEKTTTIPLDGQSDNVMKSLTNDTADSSVQLDNASSRKVSISLVENINNEAAENNICTLDTDEDEDMTEADEATCENCDCIACKDGEVIASTLEFGGRLGCQVGKVNLKNTTCFILNSNSEVAVANCVTSYWGTGHRAQRGKVTKIDSTDRVTVRWVDGSKSQFNVHPTERPDTDTVLCFHCR